MTEDEAKKELLKILKQAIESDDDDHIKIINAKDAMKDNDFILHEIERKRTELKAIHQALSILQKELNNKSFDDTAKDVELLSKFIKINETEHQAMALQAEINLMVTTLQENKLKEFEKRLDNLEVIKQAEDIIKEDKDE